MTFLFHIISQGRTSLSLPSSALLCLLGSQSLCSSLWTGNLTLVLNCLWERVRYFRPRVMVGIATLGNGNQDQLISPIVLLAFSGSPLFLRLMGHAGWISQEELTPHPFPISKKGLPYQWAKACPFPPIGWHLTI